MFITSSIKYFERQKLVISNILSIISLFLYIVNFFQKKVQYDASLHFFSIFLFLTRKLGFHCLGGLNILFDKILTNIYGVGNKFCIQKILLLLLVTRSRPYAIWGPKTNFENYSAL